MGKFGNYVGRSRRHYQRVNRLRYRNVLDGGIDVWLLSPCAKQISDDLFSAERGKGERAHKLLRGAGHHHLHADPAVLQHAHQLRCFIRSNSAGHAQSDLHRKIVTCL